MWELFAKMVPGLLLIAVGVGILTVVNAILGIKSSPQTKSKNEEPREDDGPGFWRGFLAGRWTDKGDE